MTTPPIHAALGRSGAMLAVPLLFLGAGPGLAADDGLRPGLGAYRYGSGVAEKRQAPGPDPGPNQLLAPVLNPIAPDSGKASGAFALPAPRGAIEHMLQSHEFSFRAPRNRSSVLGEGAAGNGIDLDSVKVRIARDKVLIRAQFSFN